MGRREGGDGWERGGNIEVDEVQGVREGVDNEEENREGATGRGGGGAECGEGDRTGTGREEQDKEIRL